MPETQVRKIFNTIWNMKTDDIGGLVSLMAITHKMVWLRRTAMKKESITLMGVGDVLIDREQPETIFRHVDRVIRSADIAYANCEQALSDKGIPNPIQAAHHDSRNLKAFLSAGFDVVSLANNHSLDWGKEALTDTFSRLKAAGLPFVGAGYNLAEAHQPVVLERKGNKVGFLAYSSVHLPVQATENRPALLKPYLDGRYRSTTSRRST
jgi:poly-gamma-glutamate capsule biosynthesis protein CapA/YwtB (metallophosphatase superfamily)